MSQDINNEQTLCANQMSDTSESLSHAELDECNPDLQALNVRKFKNISGQLRIKIFRFNFIKYNVNLLYSSNQIEFDIELKGSELMDVEHDDCKPDVSMLNVSKSGISIECR